MYTEPMALTDYIRTCIIHKGYFKIGGVFIEGVTPPLIKCMLLDYRKSHTGLGLKVAIIQPVIRS